MKALVYETAHDLADFALERAEVPEPTLRDQDVLVEVRAIGVNPGEAFIRGMRSAEPGGRVLLGWEFAGVVIAVGEHVRRFTVGERVFGTGDTTRDGSWAERLAVDHRILAKIPRQLSFVDAASLPIGALTASEALFRDQDTLPAGITRVLVLGGAGAVGSLATQLLKTRTSALVISTASREASRRWCAQMGADLVLDHTGDVPAQLNAAGIPHVDMALSTAASADHLSWIPDILRPFGHLSVVDGVPSLDVGALAAKSLSLHTEMVFSRIVHGADPEAQGQTLESVAEHVTAGRLRPITTRRLDGLTAETMRTAHALVESGRTIGKIVIAI
ncbi:zinc-binding dehydrogenase [Streptomyces sp. NPDC088341]|uniref:alcohol dehydrogenase catalytic domain-containing protein n=1 Tax=Streptomyces sp. NPDC088341 TaxID=3154870 RepID=UPI00343E6204